MMIFKKCKKNFKILSFIIICAVPIYYVLCKFYFNDSFLLSLNIQKPSYTVVFNANGGTGSMASQSFTYGTAQNLTANAFTRTNYVFDSWNTEEDGSGDSYTNQESVNNLASTNGATVYLYAQWIDSNINITFDGNGGSTPSFLSKVVTANEPYGYLPDTIRSEHTLLGWSLNPIPEEYQELEYIEFKNGTYIDTGVIPSNHMVEVKFDSTPYVPNEDIFGTSLGGGTSYYSFRTSNGKYYWGSGNGGGTWTSGIHTLIYNNADNDVIIDDQTLATGVNVSSTTNLLIGNSNNSPIFEGKIYYMIITDKSTGNIVRNLVPVYRKSDNTPGLYDTVNNQFYINMATDGSKIKKGTNITYITEETALKKLSDHTLYAAWGHELTVTFDPNGGTVNQTEANFALDIPYGPLPEPTKSGYTFLGWKETDNYIPNEYQEVEYIQFKSGAYIDTGVLSTNHYSEVKFDFEKYSNYEYVFGSSSNYKFESNNSKYYVGNGNSGGTWTPGVHTLKYNNKTNGEVWIDDILLSKDNRLDSTTNLLIGKSGSYKFEGLLYYFKIYDNRTGELVRNFVPVYRKSDNVIGLYDTVHNKFYTNSGSSGSFEKGEDVNYTTSETIAVNRTNYTLYAVWQEHNYHVDVEVNYGYLDDDVASKQVYENGDIDFAVTTAMESYISNVSCTNGQKAIFGSNGLTVKNVTANTTCTVTYGEPGATVLYEDGTLIINVRAIDRSGNINEHGSELNVYSPFSNSNNYVFTSASNTLWYSQRNNIKQIEIGQEISPTSTAYWFASLNYVTSVDLSNLNTSNVTSMAYMFSYTGSNSSVTSFVLTGLNNWDTSNVIYMEHMFEQAGRYAKTWSIGSLSNWDTKNVYNMNSMFTYAANNASVSMTSIGSLDIYAYNISAIFSNAKYMNVNLYLHGRFITDYSNAFNSSSTVTGSEINVFYDCYVINIDDIIKTKSSSSKVYKGTNSGLCQVDLVIHDGTADSLVKQGTPYSDISFTIEPDNVGSDPSIGCTNNQNYTVSGNTFTINSIDLITTCEIYFEDVTVLYEDGTFIINESTDNRSANVALHGQSKYVYAPLSNSSNYVFTGTSSVPWYGQRKLITDVLIGQPISPTSTAYWFTDVLKMKSGDFTNLDTSEVTSMAFMFSQAGYDSSVSSSFILTGLNNWNTENVTSMDTMFYRAGYYATTWSIGSLSSWNTELVTNMNKMFNGAAYKASNSMTSIGSLDIYTTKVYAMFSDSAYMKATLNVYSNPPSGTSGYQSMFQNAATKTGSSIVVNYSSTTTNIDNMINTKSSNSNVSKGNLLDDE